MFAAFEDKDQPIANAVDAKPATAWVVRTTAMLDPGAARDALARTIDRDHLETGAGIWGTALSSKPTFFACAIACVRLPTPSLL